MIYPVPDLLVLDEATTYLDHDAFIRALRQYAAAVLVVNGHDRHFIRCVIEGAPILPPSDDSEGEDEGSIRTGTVYAVNKGKLKTLPEGIGDYIYTVEKRLGVT